MHRGGCKHLLAGTSEHDNTYIHENGAGLRGRGHNVDVTALKLFAVWGYVAAAKLPDDAQIGHAHIKRHDTLPDGIPTRGAHLEHPRGGPPEHLSVRAPDILLRSRWTIFFRVTAADAEDACAQVQGTYLPPVLAALSSVAGAAAINLVRVAEEDARGQLTNSQTPYSLSLRTRPFDPGSVTPAETERLQALAQRALMHSPALRAARLYGEARRLDELSAGLAPLQAAALLAYYKVVESAAETAVKQNPASSPDEQCAVVDRLRDRLNRPGAAKAKASQIVNAATDLRRLQGAHLSQKVARAGAILGVSAEDLAAASRLGKLRNTTLSHPGADETGDLAWHLPSAEQAARGYLTAFLESLAG